MDGEGLGGITPLRLSFLKQSLTPALDGSPYDDKMTVSVVSMNLRIPLLVNLFTGPGLT